MIIAVALSLAGNAAYISGVVPLAKIDLTPFTFTLVGLIMAFGLFRFRLLDIVPIARNVVIETMNDIILILDAQNRVVDLNPSAVEFCNMASSDIVGKPLGKVLPALRSTMELLSQSSDGGAPDREIEMVDDQGKSYFNLHISPLYGRGDQLMGRVINLFDVTEKRRTEEALARTEFANRALLEAIPDLIIRLRRDGTLLDLILPTSFELTVTQDQVENMSVYDIPNLLKHHLSANVIDEGIAKLKQAIYERKPQVFDFEALLDDMTRYFEARIVRSGENEVIVIVRDTTDRRQAEEAREKEMMLMETHHRVKNNLQVVSSLLYLQSRDIRDKKILQMFRDSQDRVRTMALIHEMLYQSAGLKGVDFAEYIRNLANSLIGSYSHSSGTISLDVNAQPVVLGIEKATPCGLIVNEIISNSLKHAFPDGANGEIRVILSGEITDKPAVSLTISDNGVGLPAEVEPGSTKSLGLTVIKTLTDQLNGELEIDRSAGTGYTITFRP